MVHTQADEGEGPGGQGKEKRKPEEESDDGQREGEKQVDRKKAAPKMRANNTGSLSNSRRKLLAQKKPPRVAFEGEVGGASSALLAWLSRIPNAQFTPKHDGSH